MELIFWLCISAIVYTYLGYAVVLHILSGIRAAVRDSVYLLRKDERRLAPDSDDSMLPSLAVVISAYNEETCISQRVQNLLTQDYPSNRYRILIGSDGSIDATNRILESCVDPRLQSFLFEPNRGKATVLNDLMENVVEELVVFSDANTNFEPGALRNLARHFVDNPAVFAHLDALDDEAVIAELTGVVGIGRWTAQMFLIFTLARPDVFAPDDLGLQNAIMRLYDLPEKPTPKQAAAFAERWAPYRSTACRYLWKSLDNTPL